MGSLVNVVPGVAPVLRVAWVASDLRATEVPGVRGANREERVKTVRLGTEVPKALLAKRDPQVPADSVVRRVFAASMAIQASQGTLVRAGQAFQVPSAVQETLVPVELRAALALVVHQASQAPGVHPVVLGTMAPGVPLGALGLSSLGTPHAALLGMLLGAPAVAPAVVAHWRRGSCSRPANRCSQPAVACHTLPFAVCSTAPPALTVTALSVCPD
mmetsp:Transcript_16589/g.39006  ORF Transcript_16589/g.39006 Transcript_16589/m.39006 type:complete len:216 (-) Transcript_16589:4719-5366(-)